MARAKKGSGCFCGRENRNPDGELSPAVRGSLPPNHCRRSSPGNTHLEVADLKDGLRIGKVVFLQVGVEARGWGAEVRDARGWGRRGREQWVRDLGPTYTTSSSVKGPDVAPPSL